MLDHSSEVGNLESAALARKERLEKLRAAKEKKSGDERNGGNQDTQLPR